MFLKTSLVIIYFIAFLVFYETLLQQHFLLFSAPQAGYIPGAWLYVCLSPLLENKNKTLMETSKLEIQFKRHMKIDFDTLINCQGNKGE